ncbi:hypothetical protein [Nonlabens sp. YIK11]|uniref:hypothetical protein n=1 Tax=Nonlabens sp. YIK11 TaxID=1453349 RepID=UPI0012E0D54C|nr:hypothetical protein [Nonlabens sp. YIK11]
MSHKSKQFLWQACKIAVALFTVGYIVWYLQQTDFQEQNILDYLKSMPLYFWMLLPVFSISSWMMETIKWQLLATSSQRITFTQSLYQNLTSQAASFLTPLRAGEFALKASYFQQHQRKNILKAVAYGNFCQMTVTVIFGAIGWWYLADLPWWIFFIGFLILLILMILSPRLHQRLSLSAAIAPILGLSALRYVLFSSSWLLLLSYSSMSPTPMIISCITAMYLTVSIVPSMQLFDLALKWSVASFFADSLAISMESMTAIVAVVWLFNTVLPVVLGSLMLPFPQFQKAAIS